MAECLAFPDDERQLREFNRTPTLISHSALPLQSPFEQPPIYSPPQPQQQWNGSPVNSSSTSLVQPPSQAFSPHHPLRPMGGPVSTSSDGNVNYSSSSNNNNNINNNAGEGGSPATTGSTTPGSPWSRGWSQSLGIRTSQTTATTAFTSRSPAHAEPARVPARRPVPAAGSRTESSGPRATPFRGVPGQQQQANLPSPSPSRDNTWWGLTRSPERTETMDSVGKSAEVGVVNQGNAVDPGGDGGESGTGTRRPSRWRKWSSPGIMAICTMTAIVLSVLHHAYYTWLDGGSVGDVNSQQWSLRLGNLFAVSVGLSLKVAVGNAYFQFLWSHLKRQAFSLRALDNLFDATGNLTAVFSLEIITKATVGFVLVLLLWALPLVSVFPPATLSVTLGLTASNLSIPVLVPTIGNAVDLNNLSSPYLWVEFTSQQTSSPLMSRIIRVVSTNGELAPPMIVASEPRAAAMNFTYNVSSYVPQLRCIQAEGVSSPAGRMFLAEGENIVKQAVGGNFVNGSLEWHDDLTFTYQTQTRIIGGSSRGAGNEVSVRNGSFFYAALVSSLWYPPGEMTDEGVLRLASPRTRYLSAPKDEPQAFPDGSMLFAVSRPSPLQPVFVTCDTYNTSVNSLVTVADSRATLVTPLQVVDDSKALNFTQLDCAAGGSYGACPEMVYQFWFNEMASSLSGLWWSSESANTLDLNAGPQETGLSGSMDVWNMLQRVSDFYGSENPWEMARARSGLTFAAAVEELSLNVSLSFMSEPTFSKQVETRVEASTQRQVYIYRPQNLVVSYAIGILLTFCAILFGAFTFAINGHLSYDNLFSSIAGAVQHPSMATVAYYRPLDSHDLDSKLFASRWRLGGYSMPDTQRIGETDDGRRFGFIPIRGEADRAVS